MIDKKLSKGDFYHGKGDFYHGRNLQKNRKVLYNKALFLLWIWKRALFWGGTWILRPAFLLRSFESRSVPCIPFIYAGFRAKTPLNPLTVRISPFLHIFCTFVRKLLEANALELLSNCYIFILKNDHSQSLQMIERPLLTPDELKSMPKG